MSYFEAVVLGLVQGLTEFLPVSSSGHLVMAQTLLGVASPGVLLEVVLHVATLLSVVIVYRHRLLYLLVGAVRRDTETLRYIGLLALATLPVAVLGLLFRGPIEAAFDAPAVTGLMLLVTGTILWSTTWRDRGLEEVRDDPGVRHALAMGLIQCLALLPGISRSGSTIAAGLWTRLRGERAAEFSFLMSLPAIAGAGLLQALELEPGSAIVSGPLVIGFLVALGAGVAAIRSLVWLVRREAFHHFAWYVYAAGLLFLGYLAFG